MNLIKRIDEMIEERSLLKHPFYEMWSDGKLTVESLAGYSKEYFQLVKAVPSFMSPIIEKAPESVIPELVDNQQEEADHIQPWIKFAGEKKIPKLSGAALLRFKEEDNQFMAAYVESVFTKDSTVKMPLNI
ncbi:MAG: hypothetical protein P8X78_01675 [Nitrosopumilaceae archaeon]